jgi:hypothetical protein
MVEYTRAVSGQWLSKHIPAATNVNTTTKLLLETRCFYMVRAETL